MWEVILLIVGFTILIWGANLLVDSASAFAKKMNVPNIVIGLTIVAFGTSAPELVVNLFASINNQSEIVFGNIIGSNIFNILVILGISSIITPIVIKSNSVKYEIPMVILSALVVLVLAGDYIFAGDYISKISRIDGVVLLIFFIAFMAYNMILVKKGDFSEEVPVKEYSKPKAILFILLGIVFLAVGGKLIVNSSISIAEKLKISQRIIALTIVSIGTSLPELATSVVAARKKNTDIAIGNIVGSNIFNVFFILGISAVINSVPIPQEAIYDLFINLFISILLLIFVFTGKGRQIDRWEGIIFILLYIIYIAYLLLH